ncbi:MAG: insulinase family protein, partial [Bacteroidota bacterium]
MLDRTIPPPHKTIALPYFPWPQQVSLKANTPMWVLQAGQQPVVKLEVIFDAGTRHTPQPAVAYCTAQMLLEGTQQRSAQAIAQHIDQYGANVDIQVGPDTCNIALTTLERHLKPMLALLAEVLLTPAFTDERLAHLKHLKIQELKVANERSSHIAQKELKQMLFAPPHPYGSSLTIAAVSAVTLTQVRQYYTQHFYNNCQILLSGQVSNEAVHTVQQHLQALPVQTTPQSQVVAPTAVATEEHVSQPNRLQAAIQIG